MNIEGIRWADDDGNAFLLSVSDPDRAGWYSALVEITDVTDDLRLQKAWHKRILQSARELLEDNGFYRPHSNWLDWDEINTTYMRKQSTYHRIKVRRDSSQKMEESDE
jgi:hypothetical protein